MTEETGPIRTTPEAALGHPPGGARHHEPGPATSAHRTAVADPADTADPPGEWHPEDDDRTAETLRRLRDKRRAHRRRRGRDLAVLGYTVVLALIGYGAGYSHLVLRKLSLGAEHGSLGADIRHALPPAFALLTLALALLAARDALWRGPVVVSAPTVGWLLAQPVRREAVLRPRLWRSAAVAVLAGLLGAAVSAVVLHVTDLAPFGRGLLSLLPAAVCLPLLATVLALVVQHHPRSADRVRGLTFRAGVLLLMPAGWTVLAATGHRSAALETAVLWSGPWGWAAQPVLAATGGNAPGWPVAALALTAVTAVALVPAHRGAALVSNAQLRRRAATVSAVRNGVATLELRTARLAVTEASGAGTLRRPRIRPPRHPRFAVPWRDAVALLRSPGRLGTAATAVAGAAALGGAAARTGDGLRTPLLVAALALGYVAVAGLAEPARLETDDVRRSAWSPRRLRTVMLHHAVLPAVLGALLAVLAALPYALAGAPWALLLMPLCAPPFAAAALVGACRGPARTDLLFAGVATPAGSPGPFLFAFWYAAGPLLSVGGLTLVLRDAPGHGAGAVLPVLLVASVLTAGLLVFAARCADRLVRRG
ncbi:DUF6297 family protein [Streptomyces sp. NPDC018031]|uniref:DUF6297 family protein n=1 Tax=Streptomyces sp. NPDC018031 TaxID=3365033 RepID=UPI0037B3DEC5